MTSKTRRIAHLTCTMLAAVCVLAACISPTHNSNSAMVLEQAQRLDSMFSRLNEEDGFQGGAIVARQGEIVWQGAYGIADRQTGRQMSYISEYEFASIGKTFTSMAVLILVQDEEISLEDKAAEFIEHLPYDDITIRSLLNHTSGLPDYVKAMSLDEIAKNGSEFLSNEDIVDWLVAGTNPRSFETGEAFEYSNSNYILLAMIIEEVSDETFSDFLRLKIFDPLGMNTTQSYTSRHSQDVVPDNYAFGYIRDIAAQLVLPESLYENRFLPAFSTLEGDGTVIGSLSDFAVWERAWTTNVLIGPDLRRQALSPTQLSNGDMSEYGFAWRTDGQDGRVYHWGSWPGYSTGMYMDPESQTILAYAITAPFNNWSWISEFEEIAFE